MQNIRPLYHSIAFCAKVFRFLQEKMEGAYKKKQTEKYNLLFKNNLYLDHKIDSEVTIRLYKDSILSKIIYDGFEQEEFSFVKNILKEGDIFIDVGANIGLFSLIASKYVGKSGKIIAFEPAPVIYQRMLENCTVNQIENIDARNIGLSNEQGQLIFHVSENGHDAWNSFAPSADTKLQKQISVAVSTLDYELKDIDKAKVKLVKIDVEGWEKFVLAGGQQFFRDFSPIVMLEFTDENTINAGYSARDLYDIMVSYGYEWYALKKGILVKEPKKIYYPYNNLIAMKSKP